MTGKDSGKESRKKGVKSHGCARLTLEYKPPPADLVVVNQQGDTRVGNIDEEARRGLC
jgi:hypothetical protein